MKAFAPAGATIHRERCCDSTYRRPVRLRAPKADHPVDPESSPTNELKRCRMADTTDLPDETDRSDDGDSAITAARASLVARQSGPVRIPKLGVWAWCFVGFVLTAIIVVAALAAVSEIVLPMTFAAVLAIAVIRPRCWQSACHAGADRVVGGAAL